MNRWSEFYKDKKNITIILFIILFLIPLIRQGIFFPSKRLILKWEKINGPYKTDIEKITINYKGDLFALGRGLLYRSDDRGKSWLNLQQQMFFDEISINNDSIFLTSNSKVFFTNDYGCSYHIIYDIGTKIYCMITISNTQILLGTKDGIYTLFYINDKWQLMNHNLRNHVVTSLYLKNKYQIYAGAFDGLFLSNDLGEIWKEIFDNGKDMMSYQISENRKGELFVLADYPCDCYSEINRDGIYKIIENGRKLLFLQDDLLGLTCISFGPNDEIFAGTEKKGIYISYDNFRNLIPLKGIPSDIYINVIAVDRERKMIYVGTSMDGIFNIYFKEKLLKVDNCNPASAKVEKIITNKTNKIFAFGFPLGLYISKNNGKDWSRLRIQRNDINHLAPMSTYNENIVICHNDDIYLSEDDGKRWKEIKGLTGQYITAISMNSKGNIFIITDNKLYKSSKQKDGWILVNDSYFDKPYISIKNLIINSDDNIIVVDYDSVYISKDDGKNWEKMQLPFFEVISSSFVDNENNIYLGSYRNGILYSSNNGKSWENIGTSLTELYGSLPRINSIDVSSNGIIFITTDRNAYYSTNQGEKWYSLNEGLPNTWINDIALDSQDYLYLCTNTFTIYRTVSPVE